jgi:KUP system potassium uptake protein
MSMPLDQFLNFADNTVIGRAPGLGVWLTKVEHGASPMLLRHIEHNRVLHEIVVLLTFVADHRPRVPFHERHAFQRLGHGFYHIRVKLGFMQTPDIPLSLINCKMLGFDVDVEHKNYYLAHETIIRRATDSTMGPISFAIFSFLNLIASRAPDFFRIPHDASSKWDFAWTSDGSLSLPLSVPFRRPAYRTHQPRRRSPSRYDTPPPREGPAAPPRLPTLHRAAY